MNKPKILIVEDEVVVALAIRRQLLEMGYNPVAETRKGEEAIRLSAQLQPDLVLMDIQLAGATDGITAAQSIRSRFSIPVVFLTAFASEEVTERAKLAEPLGYIVKPFDARELRTVIEMGLYKHQAEVRERQSREEQAAILRTALDGYWLLDMTGRILDVNDAICRMHGYSREEMLRMAISDFEADDKPAEIAEQIQRLMRDGSGRFERNHRCKGGRLVRVEIGANYRPTAGGRIIVFLRDISARKAAEEALARSEQRHRLLFDQSRDAMMTLAPPSWRFTAVNSAALALFGFKSQDEFLDLGPWDIAPERQSDGRFSVEKAQDMIATAMREGSWFFEWTHQRQGGRIIPCTVLLNRIALGDQAFLQATVRDVTDLKRAEEALKASEANFRAFFESMQDMIVVGTPEGRVLYANEAFKTKLGYSLAEIDAIGILGVHPADRRGEAEAIFAAMFRGERNACPLPMQRKDGVLLPVETRVSFGKWNGVDCVFGISKDLSVEQEAQQRFERLFRRNPALMALSGLSDRRFSDVNDAFLRTLGYERTEVIGKTAAEIGLFPNANQQSAVADQLAAEGRIADLEMEVRARDGSVHTGLFSGELVVNQDRRYFLTVMIDITERKRVEAAFSAQAETYRALLSTTLDGVLEVDEQGRIVDANQTYCRLLGYSRAELVALRIQDVEGVECPDGVEQHTRRMKREGGDHFETQHRTKDGRLVDFELKVTFIPSRSRFVAFCKDITARKRAEALMQASESRYRQLFDANVAGSALHEVVCDNQGRPCDYRFLQVNPAFERNTGLRAADLVGKTVLEVMPQTEPVWIERYGRVALTGVPDQFEEFSASLNRHFEVTAYSPGRGQFAVLVLDITERKTQEAALRARDARHGKMVANIGDVIVIIDPAGINRYKSPNIEKWFGWRPEEVVGAPALANVHPDDVSAVQVFIGNLLGTPDATGTTECRYRCKDGEYKWIEFTGVNLVANPEIRGLLGNYHDITARKRADAKLRESLREKEALLKEVHHRVKNNLQVVTSLLRLEAGRSAEPGTKAVLREMQSRIRTMAVLHETLYRSSTFASVELAAYLKQLATHLFRAHNTDPSGVRLGLDLMPVTVELDQAIPCGLLVNELLTNCLKHAFPLGRGGEVRIALQLAAEGQVRLQVSDTGPGLPAGFDVSRSQSLGLQLVSDLTRQLRGTLEIGPPGQGASFTVTFTANLPTLAENRS
jgi:PAS domain S-box-containing protein